MGHVINIGVKCIGWVAYGTDRGGQGTIGFVDLAGITFGLVGYVVRKRVICASGVQGGLIADGCCLELGQLQRVSDGLLDRIVVEVCPEHQGLVCHPVFIGRNGAPVLKHGWRMDEAGINAGQADLDSLVVWQAIGGRNGFAVSSVGDYVVCCVWAPCISYPAVEIDIAASQLAGGTLRYTTASIGEAAGGHVGSFGVGAGTPVVQPYR